MEIIKQLLNYPLFVHGDYQLTVFNLASSIFIIILARISIWSIQKLLSRNFSKNRIGDGGRQEAILQITKYAAYVFAILFIMDNLGINITILVGGSAALLVGIGLGLQATFTDFISGVIILFDGSIVVGDIVEVDGLIGTVKRIGIRATTIHTRDALGVIVPNSKFTNQQVINWNHTSALTRFNVVVGVAYGSDITKVKEAMYESAIIHPQVFEDPVPAVRFMDFGDSALLFEVLFWTRDPLGVEFTRSDIRFAIEERFKAAEIRIPFPQRDLHLVSDLRK